jgi:hypothetical protein
LLSTISVATRLRANPPTTPADIFELCMGGDESHLALSMAYRFTITKCEALLVRRD